MAAAVNGSGILIDDFSRLHTTTTKKSLQHFRCRTLAVSPTGSGGGHVAGRITRAEWQEHNSNVSALIADDGSFCQRIQRVWGYDDGRTEGGGQSCKETPARINVDPGGNSRNGTPIKPDTGDSSWGIEGKGDSPVFRGDNNGPSDENDRSATVSPALSPPPPRVHFPRKAWGPQLARESDLSPFLRQQGATDTDVAVTTPAGILGLLERARDNLVTGGLRGAFRLLKGFREEDREGTGNVTLSGFKAVVGEAGLGLGEAEMRILFHVRINTRRGVTAFYHRRSSCKVLLDVSGKASRPSNNPKTVLQYYS